MAWIHSSNLAILPNKIPKNSMDEKTQRELRRITANVPEKLAQNVTKVVVDTSEEDVAREALKNKNLSPEARRTIAEGLARGAFRSEDIVENADVVKEIDRYHTAQVKAAIRDGRLADPRNDKFIKEREYRMRHRK